MPLPSRASMNDWFAPITEAAKRFFDGAITIYAPASATTTAYDATADTGGESSPSVVVADRPARIQHLNQPVSAVGSGERTALRVYQFQIELHPDDPLILEGYEIRVTNGGKDPSLTNFVYRVQSAGNSSSAALRTILTTTDLVPVPAVSP